MSIFRCLLNIAVNRKINILTHEFSPKKGGAGIYVEEIAKGAVESGFDVTVWAPESSRIVEGGIPHELEYLPLKGSHDWTCRLKLLNTIRMNRNCFEGSILHFAEAGVISGMMYYKGLRKLNYERLILTFHGSEILRYSKLPHRKALLNKLIEKADQVTVLSSYVGELLVKHFKKAEPKLLLTPGAPRELGNTDSPDMLLDKAEGDIVLLTVARVHPRKGQLDVIRAIGGMSSDVKSRLIYWVVGQKVNDEYAQDLLSTAGKLEVRTKFFTDVDDCDLQYYYQTADVFIMTSVPYERSIEGFGLTYMEASSFGLPVIAHDIGGVSSAVIKNETGLLISPKDIDALQRAIERLCRDELLRKEFGKKGKLYAAQFKWSDSAQATYSSFE